MSELKIKVLLALIVAMLSVSSVQAELIGPIPAASLPGGVTVVDSDSGSGTDWGIGTGGRTYYYSDFALEEFDILTWRALSAAVAFDGAVDEALEDMQLVSTTANVLIFEGQTKVFIATSGSFSDIYTRLEVELAGDATFTSANEAEVTGDFSVTVRFLAGQSYGSYQPAIAYFNDLATSASADGDVLTSFAQGFFYEESGMSVEEHDANMIARTVQISNQITDFRNFLNIEIPGRFGDVGIALDAQNNILFDLLNQTNNLPNQFNGVRDGQQELQSLIVCMFIGDLMGPSCPQGAPPLPNLLSLAQGQASILNELAALAVISTEVSGLQSILTANFGSISADHQLLLTGQGGLAQDHTLILDSLTDLGVGISGLSGQISSSEQVLQSDLITVLGQLALVRSDLDAALVEIGELVNRPQGELQLDVKHSRKASGKDDAFVLLSTFNGAPVDVTVTSVLAISEDKDGFVSTSLAFTTTPVGTGLQGITALMPGKMKSVKTFVISVEQVIDTETTLYGTTLVTEQKHDD